MQNGNGCLCETYVFHYRGFSTFYLYIDCMVHSVCQTGLSVSDNSLCSSLFITGGLSSRLFQM